MSRSFKPLKRPALLLLAAASCLPLLVACERQSIPSAAVSETPKAEAAKAAPAPVYVCPMHPHITAHAPGTCPICGMDLVLKTPQASEPEASSESHSTPVSVSAQVMQTLGVRTVHALRRDIRPTIETTALKIVASEQANAVADAGIQVLGGMGYSAETDMQRYWRDSRLWRIGPITNEMARNTIAEMMGLPRSF